jgi:hypothetical protein
MIYNIYHRPIEGEEKAELLSMPFSSAAPLLLPSLQLAFSSPPD